MGNVEIRFGLPDEWKAFADRQREFLERFHRIRDAMNAAFNREWSSGETVDLIVFFIGRQCVDDFYEILLLCGNAEGYGAQKLLRAMFERVVLLKYLHQNPNKALDYLDFYWVTQHRHANAIERFWGKGTLDPVKLKEVREQFKVVRDRYKHRLCPECGHREVGVAWTPMAVADMADKVGLGEFTPFSYYEPLLHTHPNIKGMLQRLEGGESGPMSYGDRLNRQLSDRVLCPAHALLLNVLDVQVRRFKLDDKGYQQLVDDFKAIWGQEGVVPGQPIPERAA